MYSIWDIPELKTWTSTKLFSVHIMTLPKFGEYSLVSSVPNRVVCGFGGEEVGGPGNLTAIYTFSGLRYDLIHFASLERLLTYSQATRRRERQYLITMSDLSSGGFLQRPKSCALDTMEFQFMPAPNMKGLPKGRGPSPDIANSPRLVDQESQRRATGSMMPPTRAPAQTLTDLSKSLQRPQGVIVFYYSYMSFHYVSDELHIDMNTSIMTIPSQRHNFTKPAQFPLSKGSGDKTSMVNLRHQQGKISPTLTDKSECVRLENKFCD